jgi:diacylglycerol kinase family enzyme
MLVILNPKAGGGTALHKWSRIESAMRGRFGTFETLLTDDIAAIKEQIARALARGETHLVAAGGDGTVNMTVSSIMEHHGADVPDTVVLGAIGLGSSNDFHKPLLTRSQIDGIPCKLDFTGAVAHDVCTLSYSHGWKHQQTRWWIINASIGISAVANDLFNNADWLLRFLKSTWTDAAITLAALRSILGHRSRRMSLTIDGRETVRTQVKNLGVVKNPHFAGDLCYDSPHQPSSGHFYVHLLPRVSPWNLLRTLWGLAHGRFSDRKGVRTWRARTVTVRGRQSFAVECDGEVVAAKEACFTVSPSFLKVCIR